MGCYQRNKRVPSGHRKQDLIAFSSLDIAVKSLNFSSLNDKNAQLMGDWK